MCVGAGFSGACPQAASAHVDGTANHFPLVIPSALPRGGRIAHTPSEECRVSACRAGVFGFLHLPAELAEAARRSTESLLILWRQLLTGLQGGVGVRKRAIRHPQAAARRAGHGDDEKIGEWHEIACALEESLHPGWLAVIRDEKLDRIGIVGVALED